MKTAVHLAHHLRQVHFGGNWTDVNLHDALTGVDWQMATQKAGNLNTIATLVYHIDYYATAVLGVLQGKPLISKQAESFSHSPINNNADWQQMLARLWQNAHALAAAVEQLSDAKLNQVFVDDQHGT